MMEKQKLRAQYDLNERELVFAFRKASAGSGSTGEKLLRNLEMRLSSVVYRSGLTPTIFAAKQAISHRHILVDGKVVSRCSYRMKPGQLISVSAQRSPAIANIAQKTDIVAPPYLEIDKENCKVTVGREPLPEEIPANIEIMRVVEFYAR
jgi:small subunit ribosomal protein S4